MNWKNPNDCNAVCRSPSYGPVFGLGNSNDLQVAGQYVYPRFGESYESGSSSELTYGSRHIIKEMEVFQVSDTVGCIAKVTKQKTKKLKVKKLLFLLLV